MDTEGWGDSVLDGMVRKDFFTKVTPERDLTHKGARQTAFSRQRGVRAKAPGVEESLDRELGTAWRPLCSMQTKEGKKEFREGSYFMVSYQL